MKQYTPRQLMRVHLALLGRGTTLKALARAYSYDYHQLSKQLKQWRAKHDAKATSARLS